MPDLGLFLHVVDSTSPEEGIEEIPWFFGTLIGTGNRYDMMWGYLVGALLMLLASGVEAIWGVKAEGISLEKIAEPLSTVENDSYDA